MQTPEERARAVVVAWYKGPYEVHDWDEEKTSIEIADIATAIRAAVLEERQRCAALCKELTDRRVAEMGLTQEGAAHLTGYQCVAALRA